MELTKEELDLLRQWYNAIQDLNADYLGPRDQELAGRIFAELGLKPRPQQPVRRRRR